MLVAVTLQRRLAELQDLVRMNDAVESEESQKVRDLEDSIAALKEEAAKVQRCVARCCALLACACAPVSGEWLPASIHGAPTHRVLLPSVTCGPLPPLLCPASACGVHRARVSAGCMRHSCGRNSRPQRRG